MSRSRCEISDDVMVLINLEFSSDMYGYQRYDNNTINNLQLSFLKKKRLFLFYMSKAVAK